MKSETLVDFSLDVADIRGTHGYPTFGTGAPWPQIGLPP